MKPSHLPLILAAASASVVSAHAQLRLDWVRTISTPTVDAVLAVETDPAGNVYAAGIKDSDQSFSVGTAFIAAWNAAGSPLWNTSWDSAVGQAEYVWALALDGAGGLYVAGTTRWVNAGELSGFLLRLDSAGAILWAVEQPVTVNAQWWPALLVDALGRPIIAGRSPADDMVVTAFTPAGGLAWRRSYAGVAGGVDTAIELAQAPNGEIVVVGTANMSGSTSPNGSPVLLRFAPDGTQLQALEIVLPEIVHGWGVDVEVDAQGRIFVGTTSRATSFGTSSVALLAFDPAGTLNWVRTITGPDQFPAGGVLTYDVEIDVFGRVLVLGGRAQGENGRGILIAAYDTSGVSQYQTIVNDALGSSEVEIWNSPAELLVDPSGEAVAAGTYAPVQILQLRESDALAFGVDSRGQKRYGIVYSTPPSPNGSWDTGYAGALGSDHTLVLGGSLQVGSPFSADDAFVAHYTRTAIGTCHGDGAPLACPCGNTSAADERAGCASSLGVGGRLADLGASSLAADTFVLVGTSMPDSSALYFQGTVALAGAAFGDGLRCAGGTVVRLGTKTNAAGTSRYPGAGDPAVSVRGLVTTPGARAYQVWYRNAAAFCTPDTFNLTNGMSVTWTF